MDNIWNSQELTIVLVSLPGNNCETVPLLFFSRTEDEVLPVLSSRKFRKQLLDLLHIFYISSPKCRLCLFVSTSFSKSPLPHNWLFCSKSALSQRETVLFSSKLWSGRNWDTDLGGGAGSRGSPLLPPRFHPPRRLPPWRSLAAHHHIVLPEEQLGGSAAEGNDLWSRVSSKRSNHKEKFDKIFLFFPMEKLLFVSEKQNKKRLVSPVELCHDDYFFLREFTVIKSNFLSVRAWDCAVKLVGLKQETKMRTKNTFCSFS